MTSLNLLKPLSIGFVTGGVVCVVVAFSAGWIVSASKWQNDVELARISTLAEVCVTHAHAYREANGVTTELAGYGTDARKAREALAEQFAVILPDQKEFSEQGANACANALDRTRA